MGKQIDEVNKLRDINGEFTMLTMGEVVDTNDPQQMGRLRVACPLLGDLEDDIISDIPWASYVSPLGGTTTTPTRGREDAVTAGHIAYGMFNVPKVGTSVLIACIDGDPRFRVWLGCFHDQFLTHTMPHGRYSYKTTEKPDGPFSSTEDKIQPLYDSQTTAFTNPDTGVDPRKSFEYRTRGADVGVSGLAADLVKTVDSKVSWISDDVKVPYEDGAYEHTHGYHKSRIEDGLSDNTAGNLFDPQTYSWSTPGFHGMSMSDNAENCRIRFRTTHGHQIIMDDTNERIYISTAGGKTWIEMDEVGNIDIYGERSISVHAKKDINFTADKNFRVQAGEGIHMHSAGDIKIETPTNMHLKSGTNLYLTSDDSVHIDATEAGHFTAGFGALNLSSTGANVLVTGTEVHLNGPPAAGADTAEPADPTTNRVPDHEPWARTMLDPTTGEPELPYDDANVGRVENGETLTRNRNWHR